jgi:hypothetical protein
MHHSRSVRVRVAWGKDTACWRHRRRVRRGCVYARGNRTHTRVCASWEQNTCKRATCTRMWRASSIIASAGRADAHVKHAHVVQYLDHAHEDFLLALRLDVDGLLDPHCPVRLLLVRLCLHIRGIWHLQPRNAHPKTHPQEAQHGNVSAGPPHTLRSRSPLPMATALPERSGGV